MAIRQEILITANSQGLDEVIKETATLDKRVKNISKAFSQGLKNYQSGSLNQLKEIDETFGNISDRYTKTAKRYGDLIDPITKKIRQLGSECSKLGTEIAKTERLQKEEMSKLNFAGARDTSQLLKGMKAQKTTLLSDIKNLRTAIKDINNIGSALNRSSLKAEEFKKSFGSAMQSSMTMAKYAAQSYLTSTKLSNHNLMSALTKNGYSEQLSSIFKMSAMQTRSQEWINSLTRLASSANYRLNTGLAQGLNINAPMNQMIRTLNGASNSVNLFKNRFLLSFTQLKSGLQSKMRDISSTVSTGVKRIGSVMNSLMGTALPALGRGIIGVGTNIAKAFNFTGLLNTSRGVLSRISNMFVGGMTAGLYSKLSLNFDKAVSRYDILGQFANRTSALKLGTRSEAEAAVKNMDDFVKGTKISLDTVTKATESFGSITGSLHDGVEYAKSFSALSLAADVDARDQYAVMRELRYLLAGTELNSQQWSVFMRHWSNVLRLLGQERNMSTEEYFEYIKEHQDEFKQDLKEAYNFESIEKMVEINKDMLNAALENVGIAGARGWEKAMRHINDAIEKTTGRSLPAILGGRENSLASMLTTVWETIGKSISEKIPQIKTIIDKFRDINLKEIVDTIRDIVLEILDFVTDIAAFMAKHPKLTSYFYLFAKVFNVRMLGGALLKWFVQWLVAKTSILSAAKKAKLIKTKELTESITESAGDVSSLANAAGKASQRLKNVGVRVAQGLIIVGGLAAAVGIITAVVAEISWAVQKISDLKIGDDYERNLSKVRDLASELVLSAGVITTITIALSRTEKILAKGLKGIGIGLGITAALGGVLYILINDVKAIGEAFGSIGKGLTELSDAKIPDSKKVSDICEALADDFVALLDNAPDAIDSEQLSSLAEGISAFAKSVDTLAKTKFPSFTTLESFKTTAEAVKIAVQDILKVFGDEDKSAEDYSEEVGYTATILSTVNAMTKDLSELGKINLDNLEKQITNVTSGNGVLRKIKELKSSIDKALYNFYNELNYSIYQKEHKEEEPNIGTGLFAGLFGSVFSSTKTAFDRYDSEKDEKTFADSLTNLKGLISGITPLVTELKTLNDTVTKTKFDPSVLGEDGNLSKCITNILTFFNNNVDKFVAMGTISNDLINYDPKGIIDFIKSLTSILTTMNSIYSDVVNNSLFKNDENVDLPMFSARPDGYEGGPGKGVVDRLTLLTDDIGKILDALSAAKEKLMALNASSLQSEMTILENTIVQMNKTFLWMGKNLVGTIHNLAEDKNIKGSEPQIAKDMQTIINAIKTGFNEEDISTIQTNTDKVKNALQNIIDRLIGDDGLNALLSNLQVEVGKNLQPMAEFGTTVDAADTCVMKLQNRVNKLNSELKTLVDNYTGKDIEININITDLSSKIQEIEALVSALEKLNATPAPSASTGPTSMAGLTITASKGGLIPGFGNGGRVGGRWSKPVGTDTVPAMLTPGEFVQNRKAVSTFGTEFMTKINNLDLVGAFKALSNRGAGMAANAIGRTNITNNYVTHNNNAKLTQHIYGGDTQFSFRRANRYIRSL